jgi:hypothetical protein
LTSASDRPSRRTVTDLDGQLAHVLRRPHGKARGSQTVNRRLSGGLLVSAPVDGLIAKRLARGLVRRGRRGHILDEEDGSASGAALSTAAVASFNYKEAVALLFTHRASAITGRQSRCKTASKSSRTADTTSGGVRTAATPPLREGLDKHEYPPIGPQG